MSRVRFPGFLTGTWTELDGTGRNWTELDGTLSRVRFPGFVTGTWTELDGTGRNSVPGATPTRRLSALWDYATGLRRGEAGLLCLWAF
jgi:hypothetical protein